SSQRKVPRRPRRTPIKSRWSNRFHERWSVAPGRSEEVAMCAIRRAMLVSGLFLSPLGGGVSAAEKDLNGDTLPPGAVARLGTTRLSHSKVIHSVAFSPDGKILA